MRDSINPNNTNNNILFIIVKEIDMKIFTENESYKDKVNFVDENNVLVGYDLSQDCCERADWFISPTKENSPYNEDCEKKIKEVPDVYNYAFDKNFFEEVKDCEQLDKGTMIRFRLVNRDKELFLHLFNCQNGYYSHGFEFKIDDQLKKEGYI